MRTTIEDRIRQFYGWAIYPWFKYLLPVRLRRRLVRVPYVVVGYRALLGASSLPLRDRLRLIRKFVRVDLNVQHAHRPCEITAICKELLRRPSRPDEVFIEAGCWKGGSTAKFSAVCELLGMKLLVYDSFEGVEPNQQEGYDYSGEYAARQEEVMENVRQYGCLDVCSFFPGWFKDTIQAHPPQQPVRVVYIDCDLASGTREVLAGALPSLVSDGVVFTQDYHIKPVRDLLTNPATWGELGVAPPRVVSHCHNTAALHFAVDSAVADTGHAVTARGR